MPVSTKLAVAIALALAIAPHVASAAQLDYSLYTGIEHSNNINQASSNPLSQNVLIPGVNFTFLQEGSTVQANVAGDLEYRDYLGSRFSNQAQAQLAGQVNWTMMPERLDFTVQDFAGVQPVDRLASNSPDNQQQTNVFTIGPTLHFGMGSTLRGQAELRYIGSYAQKTKDFNSNRSQGAVRVFKELSATDVLSLNVESQHIDFTHGGNSPNYDRNQLFGRYTRKLVHFNVDVSVGWSQLDFDRADTSKVSSPLTKVTLDWLPTQRSVFTFTAVRQYSDAASDMTTQQPSQLIEGTDTGISMGNAVIDSQVYLDRRAELTYSFTGERLTVSVSPLYRKLDYVNGSNFNQTGRGGSATIDYRLRPTLTLSAFGTHENLIYNTLDRRDRNMNYGLSLAHQWTPHWMWRASVSQQRRDSTAADQSFHENQIYLGIIYKR
jgi:hypothetical protein